MTKANNYIKISGILYLLFSLFIILYFPLLGGPLLVIGIILLSNSFLSLEELNKNKVSLIIIAILSILLNQIAAILIFVSLDEISSAKKNSINSPPEEQVSSESKRIDMLLKLGLAMILLAGILFATTSWEIISDLLKLIALLIMGGAFLGLSKFSEVKLKIERTTKAYFILGISFFILAWVGIGYFAPFSDWFSYHGEGNALVYFITFILVAGAFYLVNHKFKDNECLYLGHASMYLSVFALLSFFGLKPMYVLLIMSALSVALNFIPRTEKLSSLQNFNKIVSFLYWPIIITESFDANFIALVVTSTINIFNMIYIAAKDNDNAENFFAAVVSYALIFISLINIPYDIDDLLAVFIAMTTFSLIIKYNPFTKNKYLIGTSQIIYHFISLIIIFIYFLDTSIESIIITGVYLVANIVNSLDLTKTNDQVDLRYQPFVIFYFVYSILNYFCFKVMEIDFILVLAVCTLIYSFINFISKKETIKNYYLVFTIIAAVLTYLTNLVSLNFIAGSIALLAAIYIYLQTYEKSEEGKIFSYIFILLSIQALCTQLLPITYGSLLSLMIFILLILIIKDKKLDVVNYVALVVPLLTIIENLDYQYLIFKTIAINLLALYILFLILKFFVKNKETKDIVAAIVYPVIICAIIFERELAYGLYIGIISVAIIFITFNEEEYKKTFYASIIITVLNIIVQLWEFWGLIPFWLYLLVFGIGIVAFVTYKELNRSNEPAKPQLPEKKEISNDELPASMSTFPVEQAQPINPDQCNCESNHSSQQEHSQNINESVIPTDQVKVGNFCPTCGTPNKGGRFCAICGRNLVIKK